MNDYVILTDSTSDLPPNIVHDLKIGVLPMKFTIEGKEYHDGEMSAGEFYGKTRNKSLATTSQINPNEFKQWFEEYLKQGKDILYVCLSSSLSGTFNSACMAKNELEQCYPDNKIKVVDSLSASLGEGFLVYTAANMKKNGASIEQAESWINENRRKVCHWFIVDDLYHLKRSGRLSQTVAFFGSMVSIKPILHVDENGKLVVAEKVRGKNNAIDAIVAKLERFCEDIENKVLLISHADCLEDANILAEKIRNKFKFKKLIISNVSPVIGTHVGHGTLALFFLGSQR